MHRGNFFCDLIGHCELGNDVQLFETNSLSECWPGRIFDPRALDFSSRLFDGLFCC